MANEFGFEPTVINGGRAGPSRGLNINTAAIGKVLAVILAVALVIIALAWPAPKAKAEKPAKDDDKRERNPTRVVVHNHIAGESKGGKRKPADGDDSDEEDEKPPKPAKAETPPKPKDDDKGGNDAADDKDGK